jgi:hypothetical protein
LTGGLTNPPGAREGWFQRWSASAYARSPEWLGACRIAYALSLLAGWHPRPMRPLAALGEAFFFPPLGPFELLDGYPGVRALQALALGRDLSLVALLVGYRTRLAGCVAGLTQIALAGLRYSTGKIDHELLIFALPIVMSFSAWGAALSVDAARARPSAAPARSSGPALAYLALLIGMTFFTSGFLKALTGWLDPGASATRGYLLAYLRQHPWSVHALNTTMAALDVAWLWKPLDWATLAFELVVLLAVLRAIWFRAALAVAMTFHLGVVALLNIDFSLLLLCYLPFLFDPPPGALARVRVRVERALGRVGRWWLVVLAGAGGAIWYAGQRRGYGTLFGRWPQPPPLSLGVAVMAATLGLVVWREWLPRLRGRAVPEVTHSDPVALAGRGRRWLFLGTALLLPLELALTLLVSEPYPAPMGPLFMGNPDLGGRARSFRQELAIVGPTGTMPVDATELLGVPEPYASNILTLRFPLTPVSSRGVPVASQTWLERLATQGDRFRALPRHGVQEPLRAPERDYLRRRFPDAERLDVTWWREVVGMTGGRLTLERVPLNSHRLTLR